MSHSKFTATGLRRYLACTMLIALFAALGCSRMVQASKDGERLNTGLHAQMAKADWDAIYANADDGYREKMTASQSRDLFSSVVRKLGNPVDSKQTRWTLNTNTSGSFLQSQCQTTFSIHASAQETIVWKLTDGGYRLYRYGISSPDLVTR